MYLKKKHTQTRNRKKRAHTVFLRKKKEVVRCLHGNNNHGWIIMPAILA